MSRRSWLGILAVGSLALAIFVPVLAEIGRHGTPTQHGFTGVSAKAVEEPGTTQIRLSAYMAPMAPEQLVYRADAGLEGDIVAISPARWSTVSGGPPDGWKPGQAFLEPEVVYRSATVRVTNLLYGDAGKQVNVAMLGGTAGGVTMTFEDSPAPDVSVGDHVVFFVSRPSAAWRLGADNLGLVQGYVVSAGQASTPGLPPVSMSDLSTRVHAEAARRVAGAVEPAAE